MKKYFTVFWKIFEVCYKNMQWKIKDSVKEIKSDIALTLVTSLKVRLIKSEWII